VVFVSERKRRSEKLLERRVGYWPSMVDDSNFKKENMQVTRDAKG